jgi:transcriptional regulator with XRE-family HTH domain
LGTSKQVLSRYETNQRAPKITLAKEYADKLGISLDYMLGNTAEELDYAELATPEKNGKRRPFYKIFIEVTHDQLGLDIPGVVRVTGLTDAQVRRIIMRHVKDAPLPLALLLTDTLGVPLTVWTGDLIYKPVEISVEAREIALAYDRANTKDRNTARLALDLEPIQPPKGVRE